MIDVLTPRQGKLVALLQKQEAPITTSDLAQLYYAGREVNHRNKKIIGHIRAIRKKVALNGWKWTIHTSSPTGPHESFHSYYEGGDV